jgi:hypothetical protein
LLNPGFIKLFFLQYAFVFGGQSTWLTPMPVMMAYVMLIITAMCFLFRKALTSQNIFGFISLSVGLLFFLATAVAYRYFPERLSPYDYAVRNFYMPSVTFMWGLIAVLPQKNLTTISLTLMTILFAIETVEIVGRNRLTDFQWKEYAQKIPEAETLKIPINPPGWFINIPRRF